MRRLQALVLRTGTGPLGPIWRALYAALVWSIAACLRRGRPDTTVYVGGSLGFGEPVPGLSDVDVIAVCAGDARPIRDRWRRVVRCVPLLHRVAADVFVYSEEELRRAAAPCSISPETFVRHDDVHDAAGLAVRPGPFGATREWRRLAGPERRPVLTHDAQSRRLAAWLELQFWWRFAFEAAADSAAPTVPFLCVKLIAEPARLWLWLEHDQALFRRRDVLREASAALPQEREAYALALALQRDLPRGPRPPLAQALASLTRQSALLAGLMDRAAGAAGADPVRLIGVDAGPPVLADWRALVAPSGAGERFQVAHDDLADPAALARLGALTTGPAPALHAAPLLVRPAAERPRAKLRAVQCAATDPVSFALLAGEAEARFPRLPGWSARDWARRAVAEHRTWLCHPGATRLNGYGWLQLPPERERLITAARAALFEQSIDRGEPELRLTTEAVGDGIGADLRDERSLRDAVLGLPAYR
jgi:predicted nucleotidyltransferase